MAGESTTYSNYSNPASGSPDSVYVPYESELSGWGLDETNLDTESTADVNSTQNTTPVTKTAYSGTTSTESAGGGATDYDPSFWADLENASDASSTSLEHALTTGTSLKHYVSVSDTPRTSYYDLIANEGTLNIVGVPATGSTRVSPIDADTFKVDVILNNKIVDTMIVNALSPLGHIFIQGGSAPDLTAVASLDIASHIHFNEAPADLPKHYQDTVNASSLYRLGDLRYCGDSYTFTVAGENAVIDLIADHGSTYTLHYDQKGVDKSHYNITIDFKNSDGNSDTVYLRDVPKKTTINLFGGTLKAGELPQDIKNMLAKNFTPQTTDSLRDDAIKKHTDKIEADLDDLSVLPGVSKKESDAVYQKAWKLIDAAISFATLDNTAGNLAERMTTLVAEIEANYGKDASKRFVQNITKIIAKDYPELLEKMGQFGMNTILGNTLLDDPMSAMDIAFFLILNHASGIDDDESMATLKTFRDKVTTLSPDDFNALITAGKSYYRTYLNSSAMIQYEKDKAAGELTLALPNTATQKAA